jgi:hypothetical protein
VDDLNRTALDIAWKLGMAEICDFFQTVPKCPPLAIAVGASEIQVD